MNLQVLGHTWSGKSWVTSSRDPPMFCSTIRRYMKFSKILISSLHALADCGIVFISLQTAVACSGLEKPGIIRYKYNLRTSIVISPHPRQVLTICISQRVRVFVAATLSTRTPEKKMCMLPFLHPATRHTPGRGWRFCKVICGALGELNVCTWTERHYCLSSWQA